MPLFWKNLILAPFPEPIANMDTKLWKIRGEQYFPWFRSGSFVIKHHVYGAAERFRYIARREVDFSCDNSCSQFFELSKFMGKYFRRSTSFSQLMKIHQSSWICHWIPQLNVIINVWPKFAWKWLLRHEKPKADYSWFNMSYFTERRGWIMHVFRWNRKKLDFFLQKNQNFAIAF